MNTEPEPTDLEMRVIATAVSILMVPVLICFVMGVYEIFCDLFYGIHMF